ncbi:MAG TPA: hypothetical protein VFZ17_04310 [Acidimicrobiia bacterium]|nr:hypothetical protein [Acidimicrobiia bacterium]
MQGRREGGRWVALAAIALVPLAILACRGPWQQWVPIGDNAIMGLRVGDVFTSDTPLVGAYSKFGWSHPGPVLFYLQALPYRILGSTSDALLVGSVLVNALSVVVLARTLWRVAGTAFAVACLACVGFAMWTLGTSWLWYTWNPNLALLAFACFLALAWSVSVGNLGDLPWLAAFGTLVVQAHVGYALVVIVIATTAGALWWVDRRTRETHDVPARRPLLVTLLVLVVLWAAPVLDALEHGGGNLRELAEFFLEDNPHAGWRTASRIMGLALSERGPWLGFAEPVKFADVLDPRGTPIPWGLLLLVGATILAVRRRDVLARNLCVICLVAIAVGLVSLSRIVGDIFVYMVFWTRVIAAFSWVVAIWTLLRGLRGDVGVRVRHFARPLAFAAGAVALTLLCVSALRAGIGPWAETSARQGEEVASIVPDIVENLGTSSHVHLSSDAQSFYAGTFHAGLELLLAQQGFDTDDTDDAVELEVVVGSEAILQRRAAGDVPIALSRAPGRDPRNVPPPHDGEELSAYLDRLESIAPRKFHALVRARDPASPIAVYRTP